MGLYWTALFVVVPLVELVVEFKVLAMLVGTGTSSPEVMTAFLLLLVKMLGLVITRNLSELSSALSATSKALPVARIPVTPPAPPASTLLMEV